MPTETKSYTPGAERAALDIAKLAEPYPLYGIAYKLAEIISRETHDAEMLEALRLGVQAFGKINLGLLDKDIAMFVYRAQLRAESLIAKVVEGQ